MLPPYTNQECYSQCHTSGQLLNWVKNKRAIIHLIGRGAHPSSTIYEIVPMYLRNTLIFFMAGTRRANRGMEVRRSRVIRAVPRFDILVYTVFYSLPHRRSRVLMPSMSALSGSQNVCRAQVLRITICVPKCTAHRNSLVFLSGLPMASRVVGGSPSCFVFVPGRATTGHTRTPMSPTPVRLEIRTCACDLFHPREEHMPARHRPQATFDNCARSSPL